MTGRDERTTTRAVPDRSAVMAGGQPTMIETDVLIIGSGPAGSASALALSAYGVPNVLVTKYRWLANTPRAHITNQRTFEVLRVLGVESEA